MVDEGFGVQGAPQAYVAEKRFRVQEGAPLAHMVRGGEGGFGVLLKPTWLRRGSGFRRVLLWPTWSGGGGRVQGAPLAYGDFTCGG